MRFSVKNTYGTARVGLLHGEHPTQFNMETPNVFLYTKGGTIPHITPDVLKKITKDRVALHFPVPNILHTHERMKHYQGSIADFTGLKDHVTYVSIIDPGKERIKGYHKTNYVSVWTNCGRREMNVENYMDFIEALQPNMFLTLCDGDTDPSSSKKRVLKSLNRSLEFFTKCLELHNKSEGLKNCKIIGALEGGFDIEAREKCSSVVGETSVFGVAVDGLHCSEKQNFEFEEIKPMVDASLKYISPDKLRICHGTWSPNMILALITLGVDIFDASYPYLVAEEGGALIFPNDESIFEDNGQSLDVNKENHSKEPINKKLKLRNENRTSPYFISLKDEGYTDSFEPISKDCNCLACIHHTKAYIHHLLHVNELLGPILLMM